MFCFKNSNLGGLRFGVDGEGNYGYLGADDCFIPFKYNQSGVLEMQSEVISPISKLYENRLYSTQGIAITFTKPFSKVPSVWCSSTNGWSSCWVGDVTTTGFVLYHLGTHSSIQFSTIGFSWVAYTTEE